MDMDKNIVNRALYAAGQKVLSKEDIENKTATFELCKDYYLATFLEALSEVPWTSGKRRRHLLKSRLPHPHTAHRFVYDLPYDCARPVELLGGDFFVIEGRFLCTDSETAELLYVTNGKTLREIRALEAPAPGELIDLTLSTGMVHEDGIPVDVTLFSGSPADIPWHGTRVNEQGDVIEEANAPGNWPKDWRELLAQGKLEELQAVPLPADPEPSDAYPDYQPPEYEPKFYEYIEKMLAAKFAVKLSDKPELHALLLQESQLIKDDAITTSKSTAAARKQPNPWWTETRGPVF